MTPHHEWSPRGTDAAGMLAELREATVNYDPAEVTRAEWNVDTQRTPLATERPGPPESGGAWEAACGLVEAYEFSAPSLVRAVYDPAEALLGRTMLLQTRFYGLHLYCGVRVTAVVDETRANGERAWGWSYETLQGHLERGKITYEVVKHPDTGRVEFVISSYSQGARSLGAVLRLGWRVFGRRAQLRFYRECGDRLARLVDAAQRGVEPPTAQVGPDGLVRAPSDAHAGVLDRIAVRRRHPGRLRG